MLVVEIDVAAFVPIEDADEYAIGIADFEMRERRIDDAPRVGR